MIRALMAAASGMQAQQMNVDTIANNLANVNTSGFKRSQVMFQDMLYDTIRASGGNRATARKTPSGVQMGLGTRMVSIKVFTPGSLQVTNRDLDVASTARVPPREDATAAHSLTRAVFKRKFRRPPE